MFPLFTLLENYSDQFIYIATQLQRSQISMMQIMTCFKRIILIKTSTTFEVSNLN